MGPKALHFNNFPGDDNAAHLGNSLCESDTFTSPAKVHFSYIHEGFNASSTYAKLSHPVISKPVPDRNPGNIL